jgi:hypothetical protein
MTDEVDAILNDYLILEEVTTLVSSGTPLENIRQKPIMFLLSTLKVNL